VSFAEYMSLLKATCIKGESPSALALGVLVLLALFVAALSVTLEWVSCDATPVSGTGSSIRGSFSPIAPPYSVVTFVAVVPLLFLLIHAVHLWSWVISGSVKGGGKAVKVAKVALVTNVLVLVAGGTVLSDLVEVAVEACNVSVATYDVEQQWKIGYDLFYATVIGSILCAVGVWIVGRGFESDGEGEEDEDEVETSSDDSNSDAEAEEEVGRGRPQKKRKHKGNQKSRTQHPPRSQGGKEHRRRDCDIEMGVL